MPEFLRRPVSVCPLNDGQFYAKSEVIPIMNRLDEIVFRNGRLLLEDDDQSNETCNECGQSVRIGSGKFVNRVIDLNGYKTRKEMGKPYPIGDFMCADCEAALDEQTGDVLQFPKREEEEKK